MRANELFRVKYPARTFALVYKSFNEKISIRSKN